MSYDVYWVKNRAEKIADFEHPTHRVLAFSSLALNIGRDGACLVLMPASMLRLRRTRLSRFAVCGTSLLCKSGCLAIDSANLALRSAGVSFIGASISYEDLLPLSPNSVVWALAPSDNNNIDAVTPMVIIGFCFCIRLLFLTYWQNYLYATYSTNRRCYVMIFIACKNRYIINTVQISLFHFHENDDKIPYNRYEIPMKCGFLTRNVTNKGGNVLDVVMIRLQERCP